MTQGVSMLSVIRHRAVYSLRHPKTVYLRPGHRGIADNTSPPPSPPPSPPSSPPLEEVVALRRRQARRSLLVEVAGVSSAGELCRVCGGHGTIQALHHYSLPPRGHAGPKEMMLVEFSEESSVQEALRNTRHAPSSVSPPSHSPLVWLSAGGGRVKGVAAPLKSGASGDAASPSLTHTPALSQDELMLRVAQCSSISDQIQTLHDGQKLTELGWRLRFFTCRQVEAALSGLFPESLVLPFGSSVNSFGNRDCDLDMSLELGGDGSTQQTQEEKRLVFQAKNCSAAANTRLTLQRRMEVIAEMVDHFLPGCSQVRRILNARVPIIKYRQELTAIDCDLTMANRSGYHMSRMLHLYGTADGRVVPLVGAVRRWARCRGLTSPNAGRWLTNFSLTLMVLTYLMHTSPRLLLPLNALQVVPGVDEETGESLFVVPPESAAAAAANATRNTDSLEVLLRGFFEFFDKFNLRERGMSIVTGQDFVKPVHCALYIQNPLDRDLNVSRNVTLEEVDRLRMELTHARYLMEGEEHSSEGGGTGTEVWGAQHLWCRGGLVVQRHNESPAINWQAVFHPNEAPRRQGKGGEAAERNAPTTKGFSGWSDEGNTKHTQELSGLVSKLKQKAQQRKNQPARHNRKGKVLR